MSEWPEQVSSGPAPDDGRAEGSPARGVPTERLPAGTRLDRYEVLHLLGSGGMGEVYAGRDPRLGRSVAIKVLRGVHARDEAGLRRFEREARTASQLAHPNLVAIHDVGSGEGVPYLVTELLEGRTLREELHDGAIPADRALRYAVQIARALAAMHEKGVIHRDLKPSNVFVTSDGSIKVLDFGLAKLVHPEQELAGSGDDTAPVSTIGTVTGTCAYMSPEQAQGLPVDARSDIFSFGVLLHEMLAGEPPFRGASTIETLHAIIKERPRELASIAVNVPVEVAAVERQCLEKRPENRFQSARELLLVLQAARETTTSDVRALRSRSWASHWRMRQWGSAALLAVGVAVATILIASRSARFSAEEKDTPPRARRAGGGVVKPIPLTDSGDVSSGRLSPDGEFLAYVSEYGSGSAVRVRHVASGSESELVPMAEGGRRILAFSTDGAYVLYAEPTAGDRAVFCIMRVALLGGTPQRLAVLPRRATYFRLSPAEDRVLFGIYEPPDPTRLRIGIVELATGSIRYVKWVATDIVGGGLAWSPDASRIAVTFGERGRHWLAIIDIASGHTELRALPSLSDGEPLNLMGWQSDGSGLIGTGPPLQQVYRIDLHDGQLRGLTNEPMHTLPMQLVGNSVLALRYHSSWNLWVADLDGKSPPRQVTEGLEASDGLCGADLGRDGTIVYTASGSPPCKGLWAIAADGTERRRLDPAGGGPGFFRDVAMAADGRTVAFAWCRSPENRDEAECDLWLTPLDRWEPRRLTRVGSTVLGRAATGPAFTPDGSAVVFTLWRRDAPSEAYSVDLGGGEPRPLLPGRECIFNSLSPDGQRALCCLTDPRHPANSIEQVLNVVGGALEWSGDLPARWPVRWSAGGRELVYVHMGSPGTLWRASTGGGEPRAVVQWAPDEIASFAVAPTGRRVVVARGHDIRDIALLPDLLQDPR